MVLFIFKAVRGVDEPHNNIYQRILRKGVEEESSPLRDAIRQGQLLDEDIDPSPAKQAPRRIVFSTNDEAEFEVHSSPLFSAPSTPKTKRTIASWASINADNSKIRHLMDVD
eukprot:GEMP01062423.1.p1 GENE.GEMP01062423.1~~GEMP01062423.1.p1  ORF type:complete len:112 (+),score=26.17 GEMP01062423.1:126-461(+)